MNTNKFYYHLQDYCKVILEITIVQLYKLCKIHKILINFDYIRLHMHIFLHQSQ